MDGVFASFPPTEWVIILVKMHCLKIVGSTCGFSTPPTDGINISNCNFKKLCREIVSILTLVKH